MRHHAAPLALALLSAALALPMGCGGQVPSIVWTGTHPEAAVTPDCIEVGIESFVAVDDVEGSLYQYVNTCEGYVLVCVHLPFWVSTTCARVEFTEDQIGWGITNKPPMPAAEEE
jgi:hypothetical protein